MEPVTRLIENYSRQREVTASDGRGENGMHDPSCRSTVREVMKKAFLPIGRRKMCLEERTGTHPVITLVQLAAAPSRTVTGDCQRGDGFGAKTYDSEDDVSYLDAQRTEFNYSMNSFVVRCGSRWYT